MAAKATVTEPTEKEVLEKPEVLIDTEKEELKQRLSLLEKMFLQQQLPVKEEKIEEQPKNIVHEFSAKLERPKTVTFTINAIQPDDAMHDGAYIPGKALIGAFKFIDRVKCNEYGTKYTTGFEYDELEFNSNLNDEDLIDYLKEVRIARQWIERYYPANLSAENKEFWRNRKISISSLDNIYKADGDNLENLIVYYNILGGGFPLIARSYEEAKATTTGQILYLSVQEVEEERKFSARNAFIKANGKLDEIKNSWTKNDALSLMYFLPPVKNYKGFTANSPIEHIINELADYIDGVDTKTEKKKRPQLFLDAVDTFKNSGLGGKDKVKITALFNAALYYQFIQHHPKEKSYKNRATGFEYGNNSKTAIEALMNDRNIEELSWIKAKINEKWNN